MRAARAIEAEARQEKSGAGDREEKAMKTMRARLLDSRIRAEAHSWARADIYEIRHDPYLCTRVVCHTKKKMPA